MLRRHSQDLLADTVPKARVDSLKTINDSRQEKLSTGRRGCLLQSL